MRTDKAPAAVGPYSQARARLCEAAVQKHGDVTLRPSAQAVKCKGMLYASGSIGLHPQASFARLRSAARLGDVRSRRRP